MARNIKCQSYWRTLRDILCSVETYDLIDPREGESAEESTLETNGEEIGTLSDSAEIITGDINNSDGKESYFDCDLDVCHSGSLSESDGLYDSDTDQDLGSLITAWVRQFNIPSVAVSRLLHILHTYHPSLPLDARTMLHTPRTVETKTLWWCCILPRWNCEKY